MGRIKIITRRGGGLPEREFAGLGEAAEWIIEAGLSSNSDIKAVANAILASAWLRGRRFGFDWKLERPSSDETETDGQALNLGSKWESKWKRTGRRRRTGWRRRIDGSTPIGEVIARLGAEIEDDQRILEEKRRLLDERRRILVRLEKMEKTRRDEAGRPGEPGTATARQEAS